MSGIPTSFVSARPNSWKNLVLDAGIVVVDLNQATLQTTGDYLQAVSIAWTETISGVTYTRTPRYLGATRGGSTINIGKTERQVEIDGARLEYMNLQRISKIAPTLETMLLEVADEETSGMSMGSFTGTNYPAGGYTGLRPNLIVSQGDYYGNVSILATISGSLMPKVWVLEHARVDQADPQQLKDNNEVAQKVIFRGHADLSGVNVVPYVEYVPTILGS